MLCPRCFGEVQIVNNAVYCPDCKVYLADNIDVFLGLYNQNELNIQKSSFGKVSKKIQRKINVDRFKILSFKFLSVIFVLFLFFGFIYNYFLYYDYKNGCFVKIIPSVGLEFSNSNIKRSIEILKHGSPGDYERFCTFVDTIDTNIDCGGFEGGCYRGAKKIAVSTSQSTVAWTISVIVHETCHSIQSHESRSFDEIECYAAGGRLLKTIVQIK